MADCEGERADQMLSYNLEEEQGRNLYEALYLCLKRDISSGVLEADTHLPSKREFARNLGISVITVEHAYQQLIAEGYVRAELRRGYFVNNLGPAQPVITRLAAARSLGKSAPENTVDKGSAVLSGGEEEGLPPVEYDFTGAGILPNSFPYHDWQNALVEAIFPRDDGMILASSPAKGLLPLRTVIANHIRESRGIQASPDQIVVGAGAQYLYGLLAQLVSRDSRVALEDPGYLRLAQTYRSVGLSSCHVPLNSEGIDVALLDASGANLVHVMPSHHFPTGVVMPISRRYELIGWAAAAEDRYIIEDDYDCEFRYVGKPIPALQGIDVMEKVIYMNTFTKTLAPGMRIGYMVLPPHLAKRFDEELSFYSCSVPNIDQLALALFIGEGQFDKHVNRIRRLHRVGREAAMDVVSKAGLSQYAKGQDTGLHFMLMIPDAKPGDAERICRQLRLQGVAIKSLSHYRSQCRVPEALIVNHASLDAESIAKGMQLVVDTIRK